MITFLYSSVSISYPPLQIALGLVIGVILIGIGLKRITETKRLRESGVKTEGTVFKIESSNERYGTLYYPYIRFKTVDNDWIEIRYELGSNPSIYKEGDRVELFYDAQNPQLFTINNKWSVYIPPIMVIVGIALTFYAIYIAIFHYII